MKYDLACRGNANRNRPFLFLPGGKVNLACFYLNYPP